jgi:hypothetical protein
MDARHRPQTQGFKVSGGHLTARSPGIASPNIEDVDTNRSRKGILKNPQKSPSRVRFEFATSTSEQNTQSFIEGDPLKDR